MSLDELVRGATSRAAVIRVRNILNPLLWASATASPICFGFAYLLGADPVLRYGLASLGAMPIIATLMSYAYFVVRQPDRLQSEEFVIRQHELRIIERKAGPPLTADPPLERSQALPSPVEKEPRL